ncbi:MAG: CRISPR system precrRNA processing endoribonuclease RAMP protein Cas6 [Pseudomonadota bacterium]
MYLPARRYQFRLIPLEETRLPEYKGSTFRGGFGHAFKKVVCTFKGKECDDCLLRQRCVYSYVFETPPPETTERMTKYRRAPHPFVIKPPLNKKTHYAPGEAIDFGLVLIGRADDYLPYFIYAFDELGKLGIGKGKAKYRLDRVEREGEILYEGKTGVLKPVVHDRDPASETAINTGTDDGHVQKIALRFLTPLRIVSNGELNSAPDFQSIFRTMLRRISLLSYFHCGIDMDVDFTGLIERAGQVVTESKSLRWHDWERWSARQDTKMKMGGVVGRISFSGDLGEFLPYLRQGELLHVGKGTAFGLGWYEMVTG